MPAVQQVISRHPAATRFQFDFKGIKITPPQISGPQYVHHHHHHHYTAAAANLCSFFFFSLSLYI
jgi:hypothetical protein